MAKKWMYPMRKRRRPNKRGRRRIAAKTKYTVAKMLGYNGFHCFKEATSGSLTITGSPGSPNSPSVQEIKINGQTYPTWRFNLNQINDWANYARLFQQARVTGVSIKVFPAHNISGYLTNSVITSPGGTVSGNSVSTVRPIPTLVYKFDPNDHANPSSFENLLEKDPSFLYLDGKPHSIFVKNPKLNMVTAEGSLVTDSVFVTTNSTKWINLGKLAAAPDVKYDYTGLDMGTMGCEGSVTMPIVVTYYFQCKTPT